MSDQFFDETGATEAEADCDAEPKETCGCGMLRGTHLIEPQELCYREAVPVSQPLTYPILQSHVDGMLMPEQPSAADVAKLVEAAMEVMELNRADTLGREPEGDYANLESALAPFRRAQ